ncbi:MAG: HesA/MoeB/ThiF family protein [Defluviitaleaceae bacterium]|nr:HesA/MoeB/ThiF family protein [Defluviitaleaceae bacterium]
MYKEIKPKIDLNKNDEVYDIHPRYSRNIQAISKKQLNDLHSKKVCVIGSGGIGGYVVEILSRIGIHNITVVDNDVFDYNNLNRQLFSKESLIGKSKVEAAKQRIFEVNSNVNLQIHDKMLTEENAEEIVKNHDLVVDALDNIKTRFMLSKTCSKLNIPMIHGAIAGWHGQVCIVFPNDDTLEKLYKNIDTEKGVELELGNLPFTASTIASLQCAEAVKILTGKGNLLRGEVLQVDILHNEYYKIKVK